MCLHPYSPICMIMFTHMFTYMCTHIFTHMFKHICIQLLTHKIQNMFIHVFWNVFNFYQGFWSYSWVFKSMHGFSVYSLLHWYYIIWSGRLRKRKTYLKHPPLQPSAHICACFYPTFCIASKWSVCHETHLISYLWRQYRNRCQTVLMFLVQGSREGGGVIRSLVSI